MLGAQSTAGLIDLFRELDRPWHYGRVEAYTATMEKIRQAIAAHEAAATKR
jgi:hypothetical protein